MARNSSGAFNALNSSKKMMTQNEFCSLSLSLSLSHLLDDFTAVIDDDGIGQALKPPCVCCGGCGR
jgi:hypothetical protein